MATAAEQARANSDDSSSISSQSDSEEQVGVPEFQLREIDGDGMSDINIQEQAQKEKEEDQIIKNPPGWVKNNLIFSHLLSKERLGAILGAGLFIFLLCWIYNGAFWNPAAYSGNLAVAFLNLDQGFNWTVVPSDMRVQLSNIRGVGASFQHFIETDGSKVFDWKIFHSNTTTPEQIYDQVVNGEVWLGIVIPSNFSQAMLTAGKRFIQSNTSNETLAAYRKTQVKFEYIRNTGRNSISASVVDGIAQNLISTFSDNYFQQILAYNATTTNDLVQCMNPLVFARGIRLSIVELHNVQYTGQGTSVLISILMVWLGSMFALVAMGKLADSDPPQFHIVGTNYNAEVKDLPTFSLARLLWARFLLGTMICLFQSLLVAIVPLALGATYYSSFFLAWMWLFYVQITFLAMLGAIANLLGYDNVGLPAMILMILQFVSCDGALTIQLMPSFFHIGVAFPMFYGLRGLRAIYFGSLADSYHTMVNCLVILGWFLPSLFFTLFFSRQRLVQNPIPAWAGPMWSKPDRT